MPLVIFYLCRLIERVMPSKEINLAIEMSIKHRSLLSQNVNALHTGACIESQTGRQLKKMDL